CPQFQCFYSTDSGAVGVSNFQQTNSSNLGSNLGGQTFVVTYCPWQTIAMDLTPYNGQNVTCLVSCAWCIYDYDWAYAYMDAECPTSATPPGGGCGSLPFTLNGPGGMNTYSWVTPPGNT